MAMQKGDPRAKAFGRKGGQRTAAVRRARAEAEKNTTRPNPEPQPQLQPQPEPQPVDPQQQLRIVSANNDLLEQVADRFTEKAALGLLIQFALNREIKHENRIRALQTVLRNSLPQPGDPAAIAQAILEQEGLDSIDLSQLEVYDDTAELPEATPVDNS